MQVCRCCSYQLLTNSSGVDLKQEGQLAVVHTEKVDSHLSRSVTLLRVCQHGQCHQAAQVAGLMHLIVLHSTQGTTPIGWQQRSLISAVPRALPFPHDKLNVQHASLCTGTSTRSAALVSVQRPAERQSMFGRGQKRRMNQNWAIQSTGINGSGYRTCALSQLARVKTHAQAASHMRC